MEKVIVFDFDKTLTYKDTLFDFFCFVTNKNLTYWLRVLFFIFAIILTKIGVITNYNLKQFGIFIFLKGISESDLFLKSKQYSKKIILNKLYHNFDFESRKKIYIITASFVDYIIPLFPKNIKIFGSKFLFKKNKIYALDFNCFKSNKKEILIRNGIKEIDVFYTDSLNDISLAKFSKKIIIVNGDNLHECKNIEEFKSYFC